MAEQAPTLTLVETPVEETPEDDGFVDSARELLADAAAFEAAANDATAYADAALAANMGFDMGEVDEDAPFDAPEPDDLLPEAAEEETAEIIALVQPSPPEEEDAPEEPVALVAEDEDAPFDAPDESEHEGPALSPPSMPADDTLLLLPANESATTPVPAQRGKPALHPPAPEAREQPAPSIAIHVAWDRPGMGAVMDAFAADARMNRADVSVARGGLDEAAFHCTAQTPDLIIIDTNLRGAELMRGLDRLAPTIAAGARVIVIGGVNDIGLLRDLAARGVSEYMVAPVRPGDLVRSACRMFADVQKARVIAVVGARGGVGASTIAQNLAWSIAERQDAGVALLDLDLCFGTAAFQFKLDADRSLGDAFDAPEIDDALLETLAIKKGDRLRLLATPASLMHEVSVDQAAFESLLNGARRISPFVVLDLPHIWTAWVKHALVSADEVVIVAGPDLASLRNADGIQKAIRDERGARPTPAIVLTMTGVPKRPEIPTKDFTAALDNEPVLSLAFDPELYGEASLHAQTLGEVAPNSKAALAIDTLASALTGRAIVERKPHHPVAIVEAIVPALKTEDETLPEANAAAPEAEPASTAANENAEPTPATQEQTLAEELAVLELSQPAPEEDYCERARKAALIDLEAARLARTKADPKKPDIGRMTAAVAGIVMLLFVCGVWRVYTEIQPAAAAAPAPAQAAAAEPVAPPARDPRAQYGVALQLMRTGDAERGATLMRESAEEGFALAQYRLAKAYEQGVGLALDLAEARRWTERAAAGGNVPAMHDLGVYFARGEGDARDDAAAFRWFRQAAEFNVADSQFNLGVFYQEGRSVTADPAEALFWFILAARQGDSEADARVALFEQQLSHAQVEQARARADAFTPGTPNAEANEAL